MSPEPFLVEKRGYPGDGEWTERWFCPPPAENVPYQVIRCEWNDDLTVRDIYEIDRPNPSDSSED